MPHSVADESGNVASCSVDLIITDVDECETAPPFACTLSPTAPRYPDPFGGVYDPCLMEFNGVDQWSCQEWACDFSGAARLPSPPERPAA